MSAPLKTYDPGQLRLRVSLQRRSGSSELDARGLPADSWETYAIVRAAIEPQPGGEQIDGHQQWARGRVTIRIRYLQGVRHAHRLLVGNRILEVIDVHDPGERHQFLLLTCGEEAA